jgi:hypothetical protein
MADARVSWEFDGLQRVKDKLEKIEQALEPEQLSPIMGKGADMFVGYSREHVGMGPSGALHNSIDKTELSDSGWAISPYVGNESNERGTDAAVYASTQEFGAIHYASDISDIGMVGYMRFKGYFGTWVQAEEVNIPGSHYMEKGFQDGQYPAVEVVKQEFDKKVES